jgi:hypothetical protein
MPGEFGAGSLFFKGRSVAMLRQISAEASGWVSGSDSEMDTGELLEKRPPLGRGRTEPKIMSKGSQHRFDATHVGEDAMTVVLSPAQALQIASRLLQQLRAATGKVELAFSGGHLSVHPPGENFSPIPGGTRLRDGALDTGSRPSILAMGALASAQLGAGPPS